MALYLHSGGLHVCHEHVGIDQYTFISYTFKNGAFVMPEGTNMIVPGVSLIYIFLAIWVVVECAPVIRENAKHAGLGAN